MEILESLGGLSYYSVPTRACFFFFLIKTTIIEFLILFFFFFFFFSEANCCISIVSFSIIVGEITFWNDRGLTAHGPFKGSISCRNISQVISSSFQMVKFRMPRMVK